MSDASSDSGRPLSTTAQGNKFRDGVASLLRAARLSCVTTEFPIGGKNVDIYFEEQRFLSRRRVAVECKDYERPLTKEQIEKEIYCSYNPLLEKGLIDAVVIVVRVAPNAAAIRYLMDLPQFTLTTYTELLHKIMDFSGYLIAMRMQFEDEGLARYYVHPKLDDGRGLESQVLAWLHGDSSRPLAILAGYGMGKTSFARRLASVVATACSTQHTQRIPILIRLGDIANEQSLEGLLGKAFTTKNTVGNYQFELFMELNRAGKFLIILDGFDEMKHTMSWGQIKYNFAQLNRLIVPNSRVVLLGRPSAFLSEAEHYFALRGSRTSESVMATEAGWPHFEEMTLAEFSIQTAHAFMASYMAYAVWLTGETGAAEIDEETARQRLTQIQTPEYDYLVVRPVQAKMLVDIAADPEIPLRRFSRFDLYSIFITRLIARENKKAARKEISDNQRRKFIRHVAWWLWTTTGAISFASNDLPEYFLKEYGPLEELHADALKRELLTGSILEKKSGDLFYFAHRSFQEFLVAEAMLGNRWNARTIHWINRVAHTDIIRFLVESGKMETMASWIALLTAPTEPLRLEFLDLLATALRLSRNLDAGSLSYDQVPVLVLIETLRYLQEPEKPSIKAWNHVAAVFKNESSPLLKGLSLIGALLAARSCEDPTEFYAKTCTLLLAGAIGGIETLGSAPQGAKEALADFNVSVVVRSFRRPRPKDQKAMLLEANMSTLLDAAQVFLTPGVSLELPTESLRLGTLVMDLNLVGRYFEMMGFEKERNVQILAQFFRSHPNPQRSFVFPGTREPDSDADES